MSRRQRDGIGAADEVPTSASATLGSTAAAQLTLIVWCQDCRHQVEPDPAEMAERYDAESTVPDWAARLVCPVRQPSRQNGGERDLVAGPAPLPPFDATRRINPHRRLHHVRNPSRFQSYLRAAVWLKVWTSGFVIKIMGSSRAHTVAPQFPRYRIDPSLKLIL
jgi:hypothetical protein